MNLEESLGFPFYFGLPSPEIAEPLGVVGNHNADDSRTAKNGRLIEDLRLQIDIYLPKQYNLLQVNEIRDKAIRTIGRKGINSSVTTDDSTNRELWRININISKII